MFSTEVSSKQFLCSKDGFNITIHKHATMLPLNLDTVWIHSGQNPNCKPKKRSADAITFIFLFSDCGTRSMVTISL